MNFTVLNISGDSISVLAVRGKSARRQAAALPPGVIKNGLILQPDIITGEIKALFKAGRFSKERVICALNGLPFSYRIITVPEMAPAAFNEAVIRTARKEMSISPEEMYLSWQSYPADNNERQVLVMGITRHPVDVLIKTLTQAGIRPWLLDLPHLALARLSPREDAVIVDFETDFSNIVMMVDGVPRGMHMVPALAAGAPLQDQVEQVMDKVSKMVDFYNSSHPVKLVKVPVRICVTGGLLDDDTAVGYIQPRSGYNIELLTTNIKALSGLPFHRNAVSTGSGIIEAYLEKETGKSAAASGYISLEKIIRERRPRTDLVKSTRKALVPVMLLAGVALLGVLYSARTGLQSNLGELQAVMDRANAGLMQLQEAVKEADELQSQIDKIAADIDVINTGSLEMFQSREYMDDVTSIVASLPPGVIFNALDIDSGEIYLSGISRNASSVVLFADNLETTGGFPQAIIQVIEKSHDAGGGVQVLDFSIVIIRPPAVTEEQPGLDD